MKLLISFVIVAILGVSAKAFSASAPAVSALGNRTATIESAEAKALR